MDYIINLILNPWTIISLIFWAIVGLSVYLLRNKKDAAYVFFPMLAMFKTKKLNRVINSIASRSPRLWRIFWTIGIFVIFSFIIFAFWFFFSNFISLLIAPSIDNTVTPLIPGVTISLPTFAYLILPLLFVMTTHELAHGISASADGVEVTSSGVLGAGLFFLIGLGAFVEVDERKLRSSKRYRNTRLRIATSGIFVNTITAAVSLLLVLALPHILALSYRRAPQIGIVLTPEEGGFNFDNLEPGEVVVGVKSGTGSYLFLDYNFGITLDAIWSNKTRISCVPGEELTLLTFNPGTNTERETNITLGQRYYYGFTIERYNETAIRINNVDSLSEGGNNYHLTEGLIITQVNGTDINYTNGDTFEKHLVNFGLVELNITSLDSIVYSINLTDDGIYIGYALSSLYWMHTNEISKFFGPFWPDFATKEIFWLFVLSFSLALFNLLPIPVFDGDRVVKEIVDLSVGEGNYTSKKKRKDRFYSDKSKTNYDLLEYRIDKIDSVKIKILENGKISERNEEILSPDQYELVDSIGDGYNDSIRLKSPQNSTLKEKSLIEVKYEYWSDEKASKKKVILNSIRIITSFIVLGNFILSFVRFGFSLFWVPV
ncbi:MAG: site-2 protease family protein [Promethearchaeota archaeon]